MDAAFGIIDIGANLAHRSFQRDRKEVIERAIAAGITTFEPGSGGLGHKTPRGFEPTLTHSAHWLREPRFHRIISDHLARERAHVRDERERLLAGSPLRKPPVLGEPGSDSDPDPEA